jgi:hypothetical protein
VCPLAAAAILATAQLRTLPVAEVFDSVAGERNEPAYNLAMVGGGPPSCRSSGGDVAWLT